MKGNRKVIIIIIGILMLLTIAGVVAYYWYNNTYYVKTDDAKVTGDLVKISPMVTGKLIELNLEVGQTVHKDEVVGRLEVPNLPDQNIDQSLIRCPIDGVVIKKNGTVGEIVSAGQILAYENDPARFYVTANIEETKLKKIRIGQQVDLTVDQFKGVKLTGRVIRIGEAANAVFSLFPTSTGANFTKVVQKIPVDITLDQHKENPVNGTNVYVKIHVH
jgi:multidrug resistance efflux pump